ncbi:hypothetical protein D3C86_1723150 [compost metagenome]
MFSTTTIASSTTNPTATTIATSVRLFRLNPMMYIRAKLAINDTPSTAVTIKVAESWRRNIAITATTSMIAISKVISTSCNEARMVWVRSTSTPTWTEAGSMASSVGKAA